MTVHVKTVIAVTQCIIFPINIEIYTKYQCTLFWMKKGLLVYSMHVVLWAPVPMAAAVNTPSCLAACFIHVLRSPGHVATQPPCASCSFIPGQTWLTKLLLQSWLIDRECWLFLPTTILQSHKKRNSHEFSVILNGRGVTHLGLFLYSGNSVALFLMQTLSVLPQRWQWVSVVTSWAVPQESWCFG